MARTCVYSMLLSVLRQAPAVGRTIAESWFASSSNDICSQLSNTTPNEEEDGSSENILVTQTLNAYARVAEAYILHVLPALKDFNAARGFLDADTYLSSVFKEVSS